MMRNFTPATGFGVVAARRMAPKAQIPAKARTAVEIVGGNRRLAPCFADFSPRTAGAEKIRMAVTVRP